MANGADTFTMDDFLLSGIAEQIKLPFVQILHAVELLDETDYESRKVIGAASQSALRLIDGYLLSLKLQREGQLNLEPVSISSLLYDTASALRESASLHGCEIDLKVAGRYAPVMARRDIMLSALTNLGHSFIEALGSTEVRQKSITLAVKSTSSGISTGIFSEGLEISDSILENTKKKSGLLHQPLVGFSSDNAAGIFVADKLLGQLEASLRAASLDKKRGFAVTLQPSRQISLV